MQEPAGPQVLIVDDDVSMQRMLRSRLEREGYHVVTASDGDEGLSLIRKHVFNLVITDMRMPKVKGDELARSITQFNPDIPVIVMTAYGEVNEAVRLMQDGVSYYMTKPFDVEELVQRVRKAVERHRTAHEVNQVRQQDHEPAEVRLHRRNLPQDRGAPDPDLHRRPERRAGHHLRRVRNRQGAGGAGHPLHRQARRPAVRGRELRRDSREPASRTSCSDT